MPQVKMIADGVRLCYVQTDKYKTGTLRVYMAMPIDEETLSTNALLVNLLKRSCKKYPDFSLLRGRLDELYGASLLAGVNKIGDAQVLTLGVTSIDDRFALNGEKIADECAQLLASLIFEPNCKSGSFGSDNVADEKRLLKQLIQEELNDKRSFAVNRCTELMCADEPFGKNKYGTPEQVDAVTMKGLHEAWKNLLKTAVIQIDVVASAPSDRIEKIFADKFAKIEREPATIETVFQPRARRFKRHEESLPVNQGKLVMGYRLGMASSADNYAVIAVMNDLFGGGTYSKLFTNVREKLSLAYYCRSSVNRRKGIMFVECGIDSDKEKKVSAEILYQLSDLRAGKVKPEDIEAAKLSLKERWTLTTPEVICAWYGAQVLEPEMETPEQLIESIKDVTLEQICEAAKKVSLDTIYMLASPAQEEKPDED